jgi:tetratricopeptide (TPR) repeat protein
MMARATHILLLGMSLGVGQAGAVERGSLPNQAEMMALPPYCVVRLTASQDSPEWKMWRDRIGENFIGMHHYCEALNYVNRYWGARNVQERNYYLGLALDNFNYMVKSEKSDFALRGELYANRGEVFKLMGKASEAVQDFKKAISIKPAFVRPYLQLADLYANSKERARAFEVVTEGLRNAPESKALQRRYLELGGKEPFPEPVVAKVPDAEPAPAATPEDQAAPTDAMKQSDAPPQEAPASGKPANPYCRFCPD